MKERRGLVLTLGGSLIGHAQLTDFMAMAMNYV